MGKMIHAEFEFTKGTTDLKMRTAVGHLLYGFLHHRRLRSAPIAVRYYETETIVEKDDSAIACLRLSAAPEDLDVTASELLEGVTALLSAFFSFEPTTLNKIHSVHVIITKLDHYKSEPITVPR